MIRFERFAWLVVGLLAVGLVGCAHSRGPEAAEEGVAAPQGDPEALLRAEVDAMIAAAPEGYDVGHGKLLHRKPYYYKEFNVYPEGAGDYDVLMTETDSRGIPYVADVRVDRLRFATRMARKKKEAREDDNYLRDTGRESIRFEYRNGEWVRLGTFFLVDKTEENINGEWVPLEEEVQRTIAAEEGGRKGWLGRLWSGITGKD